MNRLPSSRAKDDLLRELLRLGHFRNPEHPTDVRTVKDLENLLLTDDAVMAAIASYQSMLRPDFDRLSVKHHGRPGIADGLIGPATEELFTLPRCGAVDIPEDAAAASQTRSWPRGCWEEYPDDHAFGVYFDRRRMPAFWEPVFAEAWDLVSAAYRDVGIVFFESTSREHCNTIASWERGRGWIGLAIVPSYPGCRERIWAKYDTRYRPANLVNQLAMLMAHEFGHNMGLRHYRGGVMNASIWGGEFTPTMFRGDPAFPYLERWFGGQPVPPDDGGGDDDDGDGTPPNGGDGSLEIGGEITIKVNGGEEKPYILVPKVTV